jgi:5-methylcytosine-specific restriction endonuclease McrA
MVALPTWKAYVVRKSRLSDRILEHSAQKRERRRLNKQEYLEKLKDPRWQEKRLRVFERDCFTCQLCFSKTKELQVHHLYYEQNKDPWDYPLNAYITLCVDCHKSETEIRAEVERRLILSFRKLRFTNSDLLELYTMLDDFKEAYYDPYDMIRVLQQALLSPETFNELLDNHSDWPL